MGPAGRKGWRDSSPANQLVLAERKLVLDAAQGQQADRRAGLRLLLLCHAPRGVGPSEPVKDLEDRADEIMIHTG